MKILKKLSILFLFPLLCSMVAQPKSTLKTPKSGIFEKKWVQNLEKRARLILERKGLMPTEPADNEQKKGEVTQILGISSVLLLVLSFLAIRDDGTGKDDRIVALGTLGLLAAFLMSIATFIVGRKLKMKTAKIGKMFASVNFLLLLLLMVVYIIAISSGG